MTLHPAPPPPPTRWQLLRELALPLAALAIGTIMFISTVAHCKAHP